MSAILSKILRFNPLNASLENLGSSENMHVAEACCDLAAPFSSVLVLLAPVETEKQPVPSAMGKQAVGNISLGQNIKQI